MIELCSSITIRNGLNALIAPKEVRDRVIENYIRHHRYGLLYVCGSYSEILSELRREFDVRKIFTIHQLLSILEESLHDVAFIEHDRMLFDDDSNEIVESLFLALKNVARRGKIIIYYSTKSDYTFDYIAKNADRFIYFEKEPNGYFIVESSFYPEVSYRKLYHRFIPKSQTTLEVF